MREIWKDIPNFEYVYQISTKGRVRRVMNGPSTFCGFILKPTKHHSGYLEVSLCKDGKQHKSLRIHTLVLTTFTGQKKSGQECRHLDGNKQNNNLSNLVWGTHKENMQDRIRHGRCTSIKGSLNNLAKLTEEDVIQIRKLLVHTKKNKHNKTITLKKIAQKYGVSVSAVSYIKNRKTWKHMEK